MSVRVMNAVWEHSPQKEGSLLILLALADFAHDDGSGAFPSVSTLAKKARMSERNTRYCLRKLEEAGEIVREGIHTSGATVYRVVVGGQILQGANIAEGQLATGRGGNWRQNPPANIAPKSLRIEPSVEPPPPLSPPRGEYSRGFESFWTRYPKVLNNSKKKAAQVWERMKPEKRAKAMAGLDKYLASDGWQRGFAPHATTYLRGELWDSDPPPARANGNQPDLDVAGMEAIKARVRQMGYQGVVEEIPRR